MVRGNSHVFETIMTFFHCLCFYCSSLVVVSTLDGKLSALNTQENGKLLWSLPAFHGPLLSSSLSSIQVLHTYPTNSLISLIDHIFIYSTS